jgi:hypothetical protein
VIQLEIVMDATDDQDQDVKAVSVSADEGDHDAYFRFYDHRLIHKSEKLRTIRIPVKDLLFFADSYRLMAGREDD